ncbi:MAG: hypothetical protein QXX06_03975 [Candidatus Diapherotrites archaeon]
MPNELQDLFDVITFYKPVRLIAKEKHTVFDGVAKIFKILLFYWIFSSSLVIIASRSLSQDIFFNSGITFFGVFMFFLLQAFVGCFFAFIVSRLFSKNGDFVSLLGLNYYLLSAVSLVFLVSSVPFADFAGLIFFLLGLGLYLFLLNELFANFFVISHFKSLIISVFYVLSVLLFFIFCIFVFTGKISFSLWV